MPLYPPTTCPGCEGTFVPRRSNQKYCSKLCAGRVQQRRRHARLRATPEKATPETKKCPECKLELPAAEYAANRNTATGLQPYCRYCAAGQRWGYTCTAPLFYALLAYQNGCCAICGAPGTEARRLCVDHDHTEPGRPLPRGLLCDGCNRSIGSVHDDAAKLRQVAAVRAAGVAVVLPGVPQRLCTPELLHAAAAYLDHPPLERALTKGDPAVTEAVRYIAATLHTGAQA